IAAVYLFTSGLSWYQNYSLRKEKAKLEIEVQKRTLQIENDKKTIKEQLLKIKESQLAKQKMYSIIGHDLRSPVAAVRNLTQKIEYLSSKNNLDHPPFIAKEFDERIARIQNMLDQLLTWSKLEQGSMKIRPKELNLKPIILGQINLYAPLIDSKALKVNHHFDHHTLVYFDRFSIETILRNLLDNAIKYSRKGGVIEIRTTQISEQLEVSIKNGGYDIPLSVQEYINDKEEKIPYYSNRFGLQICKELVKLNQSKIECQREENFTKIKIFLPLYG
ncbi:MAG: HAMP domain-containing sensor histidine kinase, partial [Bacteroidota bacterium]